MDNRNPILKPEQNHLSELKRKVGYVHHHSIGSVRTCN